MDGCHHYHRYEGEWILRQRRPRDRDVLVTIYYVGGGDRERQSLGVGLGRPLQSNVFTAQDGQNYLKNTLKVPY